MTRLPSHSARPLLRRFAVAVAVVSLLTAACSSEAEPLVSADPGAVSFDYDYLIPVGTADRISDGESVEILPAELTVHVGEVIRIINEDDEGHFVGIFYVGSGETVTQRFTSAGEFVGACSVHPSGQLTLEVRE
jgi:plastocyanin